MSEHIKIHGQVELERAFLELRREVLSELKPALTEIGNVVREDAQGRAGGEITNIGPGWQRMRLGVTVRGVYVAPKSRNRGGSKRPNMGTLLMDKAMQPALDAHETEVLAKLDTLVNASAARNGFL